MDMKNFAFQRFVNDFQKKNIDDTNSIQVMFNCYYTEKVRDLKNNFHYTCKKKP